MKIGCKRYEKKGSAFFKGNIFYTNIVVLKFNFTKDNYNLALITSHEFILIGVQ